MFNCLVRSDYNLIVALVCYYFWKANDLKSDRISFVVSSSVTSIGQDPASHHPRLRHHLAADRLEQLDWKELG
jgi:hypothetical protein